MNRKDESWPSDRRKGGLHVEARGAFINRKGESWPSDRSKGGLRVEAKNGLLVQAKGGF